MISLEETGSIIFPESAPILSPLEQAQLDRACWQLDAMNALLGVTSLANLSHRADTANGSSGANAYRMVEDSDASSSRNSSPLVTPVFSAFGHSAPPPHQLLCDVNDPLPFSGSETHEKYHAMFSCFGRTSCIGSSVPASPLSWSLIHAAPAPLITHEISRKNLVWNSAPRLNTLERMAIQGNEVDALYRQTLMATSRPRQRSILPPPLKSGMEFTDFIMRKVLGSGGQGQVYLASKSNSFVALKVIKKCGLRDEAEVVMVLQEQGALKKLDNPFLLSLLASFTDSRHFYLVTEFYGGGDLHSALEKVGRFNPETAQFYIAEVALGLDYLHQQGLVHRDIKPANILLKSNGHVVVADMGLVLDITKPQIDSQGHVMTQGCCGTVPFMAPEIFGAQVYGTSVDVWSLGICLFLMLTGSMPFKGCHNAATIDMILKQTVSFEDHPNLNHTTRQVITIMLDKEPQTRARIIDLFIDPFFDAINWLGLQRLEVRPPVIPPANCAAFDKLYLPPEERLLPGFGFPLYIEPYSEYCWVRPTPSTPLTPTPHLESTIIEPRSPVAEDKLGLQDHGFALVTTVYDVALSRSSQAKSPPLMAASAHLVTHPPPSCHSLSSCIQVMQMVGLLEHTIKPSFFQRLFAWGRKVISKLSRWTM